MPPRSVVKEGEEAVCFQDAPISPANWLDIILSCGLGAKTYTSSPEFASPKFRIRFTRKIFIVLLVQCAAYIALVSLFLTSEFMAHSFTESKGFIGTACFVYIILYSAVRFTRCGGDGLCFFGYMFTSIIMTLCLAYVTTFLARLWPAWMFVATAFWLTILLLLLGNCFKRTNILGDLMYGLAFVGGLVNGAITLGIVLALHRTLGSLEELTINFILPLTLVPPFLSVFLVHEVKRMLGGRRTDLTEGQWMIAAIVL